ncbi:MAG: hypothetical protein FWD96_00215 [Defluviitaleaceae bacterium]|nr:hypothetical protein [Defluviitaleaceae bacterium]
MGEIWRIIIFAAIGGTAGAILGNIWPFDLGVITDSAIFIVLGSGASSLYLLYRGNEGIAKRVAFGAVSAVVTVAILVLVVRADAQYARSIAFTMAAIFPITHNNHGK